MNDTQMTPEVAQVRLAQYREQNTWTNATYGSGTEKALHEIAQTLSAEVSRLTTELEAAKNDKKYLGDAARLVLTKKEIADWLKAQALHYRSTRSHQHALQAETIETMAAKVLAGEITPTVECARCKGTRIDPERVEMEKYGDIEREVETPCSACSLTPLPLRAGGVIEIQRITDDGENIRNSQGSKAVAVQADIFGVGTMTLWITPDTASDLYGAVCEE